MKTHSVMTAGVVALFTMPLSAQAQGIGEGARQGARTGYYAAGTGRRGRGRCRRRGDRWRSWRRPRRAGDTPVQILQSSLLPPPPVLSDPTRSPRPARRSGNLYDQYGARCPDLSKVV